MLRMGIDIGGTKANIGLLDDEGKILARRRLPMSREEGCPASLERIAGAARELLAEHGRSLCDLGFCGMGVPGTVDASARVALNCPNLGWVNAPCARYFEEICGVSPRLAQDSRAAALGEYLFGEGRGRQLLVCVTLGTGIGGGIVYRGEIFSGALGTAGEIGHIPVEGDGRVCGCGQKDCAESHGSGTGIAVNAAKHPSFRGRNLTSEQVFALAQSGNADALQVLKQSVERLGQGLVAVVNTLSPDALIFSGGLCAQRALYVEPLIRYIRTHAYALACGEGLRIEVTKLGSDAPMIGASMLDRARTGGRE